MCGHRGEQVASVDAAEAIARRIWEDERRYVIHSWSIQGQVDPLPIERAAGCWFFDYRGKRYLDFASQLVNLNLGHQHPAVVRAIQEQADRLCYLAPSLGNDRRAELGRLLAEVTPGDLAMSFFTNGGAEANENAIKLARWYTGRQKVIARYRSYHGATAGAVSLTGDPRRWAAEPGIPGVVRMFDPYPYRCSAGHPDPCPVCTGGPHLEEILQYENPETVAAVIMETVTGTNGIIVPPPGYLQSIQRVCRRHGILLILDEVMTGFGRTGRWFACEHWDVVPDMITLAKGINSGYVPLGAVVVSEPIAAWLADHDFQGGLTYSGHPLACAAAVATIRTYQREGLVERAARQGDYLGRRLAELADRHPSVGEVRGLGLFWGLELVRDRATREPLVPFNARGETEAPMARLREAALERGLYLMTHFNVVMVAPPLIVDRAELDEGLEVLDRVLALADELASG